MRQKKLLRSGISLVLVLVILTSLVVPVSALSGDQLTSSGACVMDAKTGDVLWSHNGDTQLVPASLTKVMTVYLVFEAISAGTISKDTVVPISSAIAQFSLNPVWTNVPLRVNSTYTVNDLLNATILSSACAATLALGVLVGGTEENCIAMMNQTAQDLGIDCRFYDTFGGASNSRVTAIGMASLVYKLLQKYPEYLDYSSKASYSLNGTTYSNTNRFVLGEFSSTGTVDGIKTGSSTPAGYCLSVSAYRGDQRLITVALRSTSPNGRYYDSQKLLDYGFSQLDTMMAAGAKYTDPALLTLDLAGTVSGLGAYWIDGVPYVNPRDVACLLNGTSGRFSVAEHSGSTILNPGQAYGSVGGELAALPQRTRLAVPSTGACQLSGGGALSSYRIDEKDYVNLSSLLSAVGAELSLSGTSGVVTLPAYVEPFIDARQDQWYSGAVEYVYARGIMNGTSGNTFEPNENLSRAMAVQVLYNLEGRPEIGADGPQFSDVSETAWFYNAVQWAASHEIVNGRGDGTYDPNVPVARQDMVAILYRYQTFKGADTTLRDDLSRFIDSAGLADYALEPMQWAVGQGVISGMGNGILQPCGTTSRAQMAQIMKNFTAAS